MGLGDECWAQRRSVRFRSGLFCVSFMQTLLLLCVQGHYLVGIEEGPAQTVAIKLEAPNNIIICRRNNICAHRNSKK